MHPLPTRILLLLLSFSSLVAAVNFVECLMLFRSGDPDAIGGVDYDGQPSIPQQALGFTYETCTKQCGTGFESVRLNSEIIRSLSSWILPWLALVCELPFGSSGYADVFVSVIMSIGSPALAAYSLALACLNTGSVYRRASHVSHGSRAAVVEALVLLQQIPLDLTEDERLLASIPINDWWRQEIGDRLSRKWTWSSPIRTSIMCAVITIAFALIDSFTSTDPELDDISDGSYEGHAVGTLWFWSLWLVIGWTFVPSFDSGELKTALYFANQQAMRRATKGFRKAGGAERFINLPGEGFANRTVQGVENPGGAGQEPNRNADFGVNPNGRGGADGVDHFVEGPSVPQDRTGPENDQLLILKDLGSLNRDERRPSVTFCYSRTLRYLAFVDDVFRALDNLTRGRGVERSASRVTSTLPARKVWFPPGAPTSMLSAVIVALILQCATTAPATIIVFFTPPYGLDCRSVGYIVYGGISIFIMFLSIISTILARFSETRRESAGFTASAAIALRMISSLLALANGIGLIVLSCLQLSHSLSNCYCNARVISHGTDSYIIIFYRGNGDDEPVMLYSRFAAMCASALGCTIYICFLRLAIPSQYRQLLW